VLGGGLENTIDPDFCQADADGVVNGDEFGVIGDFGETVGDGLETLCPALDELDAHETDVRPIFGFHLLHVVGGDDEDRLADVFPIDEQLEGPQEQGLPVEFCEDLVLLVAESLAATGRYYNDADFRHGGPPSVSVLCWEYITPLDRVLSKY